DDAVVDDDAVDDDTEDDVVGSEEIDEEASSVGSTVAVTDAAEVVELAGAVETVDVDPHAVKVNIVIDIKIATIRFFILFPPLVKLLTTENILTH
ncbi:hypothetical protein, partial [Bilifractor sp. HCP3S3_D3]|uniref:hypothetical protein n=1 Tax=unclassified Bilifractor TaxID=2815795 RepID=UPI003F897C0F